MTLYYDTMNVGVHCIPIAHTITIGHHQQRKEQCHDQISCTQRTYVKKRKLYDLVTD